MEELISIVVPIYNVESYLDRCIRSILNQTYKNIEVILSDDGSTDSSGKLCDEFAKLDNRIFVIHEKNQGLSEARNRGIKISKGKYICFVDSDDWLDCNYVLKLYYALITTNADISECKYRISNSYGLDSVKKGTISCLNSNDALSLLCKFGYEKHIVAWNKLYKKELFNLISFPCGKLHEDEFTTHKLFFEASRIAFVDDELYFYFVNNESITKSKITNKRIDAVDAFAERINFFSEKGLNILASKTSYLLFLLFSNFVSNDVLKFENYDLFISDLNEKYRNFRFLIDKKELNFLEKIFFFFSRKNVKRLRKNKIYCYYYQRLKQKVHSLFNLLKPYKRNPLIKKLKALTKVKKPIAYILSSVEYLNYGDLAIGEAICQYLKDKFIVFEIPQSQVTLLIKTIKRSVKNNDIICLPGGGNMGDTWKYDEDLRRLVISNFPNNKIIIFPQSISYKNTDSDYFKDSVTIYESNNNIVLCLRDNESLVRADKYYPKTKKILLPDSVFLLNVNIEKKQVFDKVAICFRNDKEQSNDAVFSAINIIKLLRNANISFDSISTVEQGHIALQNRTKFVEEKINQVAGYNLVITDRLHCIIFCAISGTPCIALNNNNNKIKNFINTWLHDNKIIYYLNINDKIDSSIFNLFNDYKYINPINLRDKFEELDIVLNERTKI